MAKRNSYRIKIFFLSTVLFLLAFSPSCKKDPSGYEVLSTPYPVKDSLNHARTYRIYLPAARRTPLPLMVYFHGVISEEFAKKVPTLKKYTGSPVEETGLISFCRQRGIALLVPTALYEYTFLNCRSRGWVIDKEMDGVEKMIDTVARIYPIDKSCIYLAGISAGAGFCHHLANHRPLRYAAILSHSQAYLDENNLPIPPINPGPRFGVLFAFTKGDYPKLKEFCLTSDSLYRKKGYRTHLLADLPPDSHRWADTCNPLFWKWLKRLSSGS